MVEIILDVLTAPVILTAPLNDVDIDLILYRAGKFQGKHIKTIAITNGITINIILINYIMVLFPIILCNTTTDLYPLTRKNYPKQFVKLFENKSLLQLNILKFNNFPKIILIINDKYKYILINQIYQLYEAKLLVNTYFDIIIYPKIKIFDLSTFSSNLYLLALLAKMYKNNKLLISSANYLYEDTILINKINEATNINNNIIILNSEVLLKNSKLRQFGEYDKLAICIPCYQETKFDIKKFLTQQLQINNIQLSDSQSETIINSSSLKRSKVKEVIEKLNLYKNSGKITDQIVMNRFVFPYLEEALQYYGLAASVKRELNNNRLRIVNERVTSWIWQDSSGEDVEYTDPLAFQAAHAEDSPIIFVSAKPAPRKLTQSLY